MSSAGEAERMKGGGHAASGLRARAHAALSEVHLGSEERQKVKGKSLAG